MDATQRLGFFGGTFDPPHRGHVAIARAAADAFALTTVLFVPTGRQPLKAASGTAPWHDRLAMVRLLEPLDARFAVSRIEAPTSDGSPNYTVDTLRALHAEKPDARLFSINGADSFLELARWREPDALLALAEWIVVSRPGFPLSRLDALPLTPQQRARVHPLTAVEDPVSATALRNGLRHGDHLEALLPSAVLSYIQAHGLYRA